MERLGLFLRAQRGKRKVTSRSPSSLAMGSMSGAPRLPISCQKSSIAAALLAPGSFCKAERPGW